MKLRRSEDYLSNDIDNQMFVAGPFLALLLVIAGILLQIP